MAAAAEPVRVQVPEAFWPLWDDSYECYVLWGGRGSGKSWQIARRLATRATEQPRRVVCGREFQNSIADSVKTLLEDQIRALALPSWRFLEKELVCANGERTRPNGIPLVNTRIRFVGLHRNIQSVKSAEGIDDLWIEEGSSLTAPTLETLLPTIRDDESKIYISFNPEDEDSPVWKEFVLNPQPNSVIIKANWQDNPWFPRKLRDQKDRMFATDPDLARHIWEGEFRVITDEQIFGGKYIKESFEPEFEKNDWLGPFYGADFGHGPDPCAAVECWIRHNRLFIRREVCVWKREISDLPHIYRAQLRKDIAGWPIAADNSRPETISTLRNEYKINIYPAKKWAGSVADGIEHIKSFEKIVIHPDCPFMLDEAKGYKWKVDPHTGNILPVPVDKNNHLWDSIRYALEPMIRKRQAWGVS